MTTTVDQLAYLAFAMPQGDLAAMQHLLGDVFGLDLVPRPDGGFDARLDGRAFRLRLSPGTEYRLAAIGWEVADEAALTGLRGKLAAAGRECLDLSPSECETRAIRAGFAFADADGFPVEIIVDAPFAPAPELESRFVCGAGSGGRFGFGHLVQSSADPERAIRFYSEVLGLALTDRIVWPGADLMFLNCNNRHHSLAIAGEVLGLQAGGIDHFMIEARSREQVDTAYARLAGAGFEVSMTIGEHTNDGMYSFYVWGPGPFRIEFGCEGRDAKTCEYQVFDSPSNWGHEFRPRGVPA